MTSLKLQALSQFRQQVYQLFYPSRDAAFEIMDAITESPAARSAVEVSLAPGMQRKFSSVHKGLERTRLEAGQLTPMLVEMAEAQEHFLVAGYAVYALDHTPYPRRAAPTVSDRGFVHGAEGQVVGHQYSLLGRVMHVQGSWVGVTDIRRIPTSTSPTQLGAQQVADLKAVSRRPVIVTADSEYFTAPLLAQAEPGRCELLIRLKGNRVLYDAPPPPAPGRRGRHPVHGPRLKLNQPATLRPPEPTVAARGRRQYRLEEADGSWIELSLRQNVHERRQPARPLCVLRVEQFNPDGTRRFSRPLWLVWTGPLDMDWPTFWKVYLRRVCLEGVHQFIKNSLAWTRARLGYTDREERWTWLVVLAYWQLLLALPAARDARRPWEKPTAAGRWPSPARVQRDVGRILAQLGTPVRPPKPRGNPRGRPRGYHPAPRLRYPVVYKGLGHT